MAVNENQYRKLRDAGLSHAASVAIADPEDSDGLGIGALGDAAYINFDSLQYGVDIPENGEVPLTRWALFNADGEELSASDPDFLQTHASDVMALHGKGVYLVTLQPYLSPAKTAGAVYRARMYLYDPPWGTPAVQAVNTPNGVASLPLSFLMPVYGDPVNLGWGLNVNGGGGATMTSCSGSVRQLFRFD